MAEHKDIDDLFGLADRVVVVAGAGGGGIGTAVCRLLDRVGARVLALDNDRGRLAIAEEALDTPDGRHAARLCDVRDPADVRRAIDAGVDRLGPVYGLAHVAGGMVALQNWAPTASVSLEVVREIVQLNFESALITSQAVAQSLMQARTPGSIVFVSSLSGVLSAPFSAAYGAAKAGLLSLMRTEAVEWGPYGIRVNSVAPGSIRTPRTVRHGGTEADAQEERDAIPLGRRGRPEDIGGAILYLLSDLAAFVSGQCLSVDGASSAKPSYLDSIGVPVFVRDPAMRARLTGA